MISPWGKLSEANRRKQNEAAKAARKPKAKLSQGGSRLGTTKAECESPSGKKKEQESKSNFH